MKAYSTREVAELIGIPARRVRAWAQAGFVRPQRTPRGHYRFTFQDLVLLRTAKELTARKLGTRRIWRALKALDRQLPKGRPLSSLRIVADHDRVTVSAHNLSWEPESGQALLDFSVRALAEKVAPLVRESARPQPASSAAEWFDRALELDQVGAAEEAQAAYREALGRDPEHVDALVNLGRLLHAEQRYGQAEALYRRALALQPAHAIAQFNLGVALEDQVRLEAAISAYLAALELEPELADVHYNLARLYERRGDPQAALRHFSRFKALTRSG